MASFKQFVTLVDGIDVTTSLASAYTPAGVVRARIDAAVFTNYSASPCWITVQIGSATGNENHVLYQYSIAAGASYTAPELIGQTVDTGQNLYLQAQTVSSVSCRITGTEKET